ncbi:hypothetical protein GXM_02569 [Nostoc sphaeroides CCNUC1]|jgi:hypothetical protein|uniref:Uncharacterized protein n=1 Tax=Nostoc sphaeroides CCNUC1 TaxID=2653204 RepID=A0A5P8VXI8_9NOSO|nr:hypothetical protein GXM_02569 [Nostoc sphaeroides CCNUC1]
MLINHTVIQNFDSSEFQANGHYRFKQFREATLYSLLLGSNPNESGVRLEPFKKTVMSSSIPCHQSIRLRNIKVLAN